MTHAFDGGADRYDERLSGHNNSASAWLRRRWHEILGQYLPHSGRIADVGCGTGDDTLFLARRGHHVLAIDPSPAMLAVAKKKIDDAGCQSRVQFVCAGAMEWGREILQSGQKYERFQSIISGFGALNAECSFDRFQSVFSSLLDDRGVLCAMPMGRISPWHIAVPRKAGGFKGVLSRAFLGTAEARVGNERLRVHYFFPDDFAKLFQPTLAPRFVGCMGFLVPPPEMFLGRGPVLDTSIGLLGAIERRFCGSRLGGDHFCVVLEKKLAELPIADSL